MSAIVPAESNVPAAPQVRSAADLDPATRAALLGFGMSLADTKYWLGRRLSEWADGAPTLEAAVGAAAIAQDEIGHARSLYVMLSGLPGAPAELNTDSDLARAVHFSPAFLARPWPSWLDVIATLALLDLALRLVFEAARGSRYEPLAQRTAKILQEEGFHRIFGDGWLARVAASGDPARARLQAAFDRVWPVAAAWLGPPDDQALGLLFESGVLSMPAGDLRRAWLARATRICEKHGLTVSAADPDWSRWEPARRQIAE